MVMCPNGLAVCARFVTRNQKLITVDANYNFNPSFAAAVIFTLLFFVVTIVHIFQAFYHKKLRLCWVLIMGCMWEFTSFAIRSASTKMQQNVALVTVSQILVLLAPMWVNAFIYMVLGRMIYFFVPGQKVWGVKGIQIAKIFVWLDVLSFITQRKMLPFTNGALF